MAWGIGRSDVGARVVLGGGGVERCGDVGGGRSSVGTKGQALHHYKHTLGGSAGM